MVDLSIGVPECPVKYIDSLSVAIENDGVKCGKYPSSFCKEEAEVIEQIFLKKLGIKNVLDSGLTVHHGGRGALYTVFCVLSRIGLNEIFTSTPYWNGYSSILGSIESNMKISSSECKNKCSAALICMPNNPDGRVDLERLAHLVAVYEYVVIDLVYFNFLSTDEVEKISSILKGRTNYILIFSTSKFCATPNLRVGYSYTPNKFLYEIVTRKQFELSNYPSMLNRQLAIKYLSERKVTRAITSHYHKILDNVRPIITPEGISFSANGMFMWIVCNDCSSDIVVREIFLKCNIKGMAGHDFGESRGSRWLLRADVDYRHLLEQVFLLNKEKQK